MKRLILVAIFSVSSAFACHREAQFIGHVKNVRVSGDHYTFQIDNFTHYLESGVCGLSETDAKAAVFTATGTPKKNGSHISGVLVQNENTGEITIED